MASVFKVRCILSCFPFWGLPGSICSGYIPGLTHQTEREDNRARAFEAEGTPLSVMSDNRWYRKNRQLITGFGVRLKWPSQPGAYG